MMSSFSDTLEEALRRAFSVQDPDALRRSVRILEEGYDPVRRLESDVALVKQDTTQLKSDVRLIAERMEQGFARMDERFKAVDGRFEAMERLNVARFDAVDKRFEFMESANAARFEQVDRRFERVDRRFAQQNRMMFAGLTVLAVLMSIYEFVG